MRLVISLSISLASLIPTICVGEPPAQLTVSEYLERLQTAGPRAVVTYCGREVPSLQSQLEHEYQEYVQKMSAATAPLRKRLSKEMSAPALVALRTFDEVGTNMLGAVQKYPPENYCPWLIENPKKASVESIRVNVEAAYARYEALGTQSPAKAQK